MDSAHVSALEAKHAGIDQRISEESRRPLPDSTLVVALKKKKLKVKEMLASALR